MSKLLFQACADGWRYEFFDDGVCRGFGTHRRTTYDWRWCHEQQTLEVREKHEFFDWRPMVHPTFSQPFVDAYKAAIGNLVVEGACRA